MDDRLEEASILYQETQKLLQLEDGWITDHGGDLVLSTTWSQDDLAVTESKVHLQKYFFPDGSNFPPVEIKKPSLTALHRSSGIYAYYCNSDAVSYIDLWGEGGFVERFDIAARKAHGPVYTNSQFSALLWSEDGTKLVYVAERKHGETRSFFSQSDGTRGEEYAYRESWGEQLSDCVESVICVLDTVSGDIEVLKTPGTVFCAQPTWSTNNTIYFVGFDLNCPKHGAIFCHNRHCALYSHELSSGLTQRITPPGNYVTMPRAGSDERVVFLMCPAEGPHKQYLEVTVFYPATTCKSPPSGSVAVESGFLYAVPDAWISGWLSPDPWVDEGHVIVVSEEGTATFIVNLDVESGERVYLYPERRMCLDVVDQDGPRILFSFSLPNPVSCCYKQGLCYVDISTSDDAVDLIACNPDRAGEHSTMSFYRDDREYNGILLKPGADQDLKTLVVSIHGGPHVLNTTAFRPDHYLLSQLGYSVLMVNFTGSLGLGRESVAAISGQIGDVDVKDVHHAVEEIAGDYDHVVLMGSSHGGFLAAHLIGQYPEFYSAASIRNPVVNLVTFAGVSDMPDWAYWTAGLPYDSYKPPVPTASELAVMMEKSPIRYVDKVTCPVLVIVGAKDLQVPPTSQGVTYYRYLKSRGVPCDMRVYPEDGHPLSGVPCRADHLMQTHRWFLTHLFMKKKEEEEGK